jgi:hypothetical protein
VAFRYEEILLFVAERSIKYRAMPLVMTNQKARGLGSHSHWLLPLTYSIMGIMKCLVATATKADVIRIRNESAERCISRPGTTKYQSGLSSVCAIVSTNRSNKKTSTSAFR